MPKAASVPTLNLNNSRNVSRSPNIGTLRTRSTDSPQSPTSPPLSPVYVGEDPIHAMQVRQEHGPTSPRMGTFPDPPLSLGGTSPKQHSRDASRSFFSNLIASKSSHKLQAQLSDGSAPETSEKQGKSRGNSKDRSLHSMKRQTSTPDLPRLMTSNGIADATIEQQPPPVSADSTISKQKSKSKLGGILARSRSGRPEDEKKHKQRPPTQLNLEIYPPPDHNNDQYAAPLKTAPVKQNYRDHLHATEGATLRNRSADRMGYDDSRTNDQHFPASSHGPPPFQRDGASLLANIQQTGRGMSDRLGKAGRGFFNKMTRSGSTTERELVPDENYVCTTINLPLVKQTRKTRIAKKLERSKDKTEYWLPALPWRCIDYLNMQCEQEGLYRVPGSGRDVKFWQRRFDTEHDINLFEEPELYDVNTIASMFKAWLRDLPDEIIPKATQAKIARECAGAQRTPQLLKDELSRLPPFNYYLLFAITCHLSLLHSYSDQNKMDYRNLCICFQPCLKIDAFCFQFLVIDWKDCWQQGCYTEKEYLEEERRYEREGSISTAATTAAEAEAEAEASLSQNTVADERAVSSSNSSTNAHMGNPNANANSNAKGQGNAAQPTRPPRSADGEYSRPMTGSSQSQLKPKQRSLSSSGKERTRIQNHSHGHGHSHGHAATASVAPRLVSQTPEEQAVSEAKLPELGTMSPIRM